MEAENKEESVPVASLAPSDADAAVEDAVRLLVDGNESQRAATLSSVKQWDAANRMTLGRRLRQDITGPFSPGAEANFAEAVRDPKRMAAVRSWMISTLLACDPVHEETGALLWKEISTSHEPDEHVRFWTLAGCHATKHPFVVEMAQAALHDSSRQVAILAAAILDPDDPALRAGFEETIKGESFEKIWPYLRAMRMVEIPAFAPTLVELLDRDFGGKGLGYDVLYTLANPTMANAAKPLLENGPGLARTVAVMMKASVDSGPASVDTFAHLLLVFDHAQVDGLVSSYLDDRRYRTVAQRILRVLQRRTDGATGADVPIVSYATDIVGGQVDQLGVAREVSVLTALILSREAIPPLAIGLFGNWGSGKSFFMRMMQDTADALAARSKASGSKQFCSNIVQIKFNAWHYTDTSLWASLATYILETLNAHFSPIASVAEQQSATMERVAKAKRAVDDAEALRQQVNANLAQEKSTLIALQAERQAGAVPLSRFSAADLTHVIDSNPDLKTRVETALANLGLPKTVESIAGLATSLLDVRSAAGGLVSLLQSLFRARTAGLFIVLVLVAVFGIPPLYDALTESGYIDRAVTRTNAIITQVGLAALAFTNWVKQGTDFLRKNIDKVSMAKHEIELLLKQKELPPSEKEKLLEATIETLKAKQTILDQDAEAAQKELWESESQAAQSSPTAVLKQFLCDRLSGDDYRKHLGLVATVRDDFDKLAQLIASQDLTDANARPIERVVLYVDDLDRCPAPKVVEVLQAVHLLLAYPLFVVVVGVDSRWLIHSLTTHYGQLARDNENGVGADWTATPHHYLEKIFQISYSIKPMDNKGYENLIEQLMKNKEAGAVQRATNAQDGGTSIAGRLHPGTDLPTSETQADPPGVAREPAATAKMVEVPTRPAAAGPSTGTATQKEAGEPGATRSEEGTEGTGKESVSHVDIASLIEEAAMTIHPHETAFAKELHEFIGTPRLAKRLVNIYRILKASLRKHSLPLFEGNDEVPGTFQVPMLLLAILIHDSGAAEPVFWALLAAPPTESGLNNAPELAVLAPSQRRDAIARITAITSRADFPHHPELFRFWIPRVARFSFGMAQFQARA
jgi:hypothetical protein